MGGVSAVRCKASLIFLLVKLDRVSRSWYCWGPAGSRLCWEIGKLQQNFAPGPCSGDLKGLLLVTEGTAGHSAEARRCEVNQEEFRTFKSRLAVSHKRVVAC